MSEPDNYLYDVFISYRNLSAPRQWVNTYFSQVLRDALELRLNRELSIFYDLQMLAGRDIPLEIARALARSRMLICLWSPGYLSRHWCAKELALMFEREHDCKLRTFERPIGVIAVCSLVGHGENMPEMLQNVLTRDFTQFYRNRMATGGHTLEAFENAVHEMAGSLAEMIENAPPYQPDWERSDAATFFERLYQSETPSLTRAPRYTK